MKLKRKIVNFLLFLILSMMALSEVPHTYITENPETPKLEFQEIVDF